MLSVLTALLVACSASPPEADASNSALIYAQWYATTTTYAMDPGVALPHVNARDVRPYAGLQPPDVVVVVNADGSRSPPVPDPGTPQTWAIAADARAPARAVLDAAGRSPHDGPDVASTPGEYRYAVVLAQTEPREPRPDAPFDDLAARIDAVEAAWADADLSTVMASWRASAETCAPMAAVAQAIEDGAGCAMIAATVSEAVIDARCDNSMEGLALLSVMCDRGSGTHPTYYPRLVIPDDMAPIPDDLTWGDAAAQWLSMDASTPVITVPAGS